MTFNDISLLLVVAAAFGILAKLLKQPLLIGYLFAGSLLAYFNLISDHTVFDNLGKIGVALLLFLVGIEMNLKEIPTIGKVALFTGLGQIIFTSVVGFLIAMSMGFGPITSVYMAVALTFSSTIIIVKLLSEKRELNSLHGKIAVGFLLIQDLVAVLILMFLSGLNTGSANMISVVTLFAKALVLFILVWYLSKEILPKIFSKMVGHSQELLFVASIAWALGISTLVGGPLGFSFEIGGFLAGLALSNLPEHFGVASKTRALRDFFLTLFFISLGSQLIVGDVFSILPKAILFSLFVLIGNPLIVMIVMGLMGYKSRTSFLASVTVAQISEFSFILMAMGYALGHIGEGDLALIVLVGAITMTASTYLILGGNKIYNKLKKWLKFFEKKSTREAVFMKEVEYSDHVVIIGCDKIGNTILSYFVRRAIPVVVVDFDPSVFARLSNDKIPALLGDVNDSDIIDMAKIKDAKMVICTVPNLEENMVLLNFLKGSRNKPTYIGSAPDRSGTLKLYEAGADYVLNPDIIAGEFLRHVFLSHGLAGEKISKMGKSHLNRMMYLKSYSQT
jgi:Kef-type K+ transport system membrane component KefB